MVSSDILICEKEEHLLQCFQGDVFESAERLFLCVLTLDATITVLVCDLVFHVALTENMFPWLLTGARLIAVM